MRWLRNRLGPSEAGLTLTELLIAAAMSVVIVGATASMLISAVRNQPNISEGAQNISAARWVQERMTREIRNGVRIEDGANASTVSFVTQVRRTACGSGIAPLGDAPAIDCLVTYSCANGACTRTEAPTEGSGGATTTIFEGLASDQVFNYTPNAAEATYVGITLRIDNPRGPGSLTVSDGASLRTPLLLTTG